MRVRAASIALVVSLLAGCQVSGGNPEPSPIGETPSASTSSASPDVSPAPERARSTACLFSAGRACRPCHPTDG